jgi:hypothetical protein
MVRMKQKVENGHLYQMVKFKFKCELCQDTLNSVNENPILCTCGNLSICGGITYGGFVLCNYELITDLSEWELVE